MKRRFAATLLAMFTTVLAAGLFLHQGDAQARTEHCPPGGVKLESGPWEWCTKDGVITSVCIKAGTETFTFEKDGSDGCYWVKGLGTECVYVGGGGTGRDCKDISYVTFYVDEKK